MANIEIPKLLGLKTGSSSYKGKHYYYIQTYTHHYDKEKKHSVRNSQKTVGVIKIINVMVKLSLNKNL